jgi:glycosyltransferase involved in cell wall biosynthesis
MFTDWYAEPGAMASLASRAVGLVRPALGRRMQERWCKELKGVPVHSSLVQMLEARLVRHRFPTPEAHFAWVANRFARWLVRGRRLDGLDVLVGFIRNLHPRAIQMAKAQGLKVVADQISSPSVVEATHAKIQRERWPGWEPDERQHDFATADDMERQSWGALDHITCGSEYVRQGLLNQGLLSGNVTVIPYPDAPAPTPPDRWNRPFPLTVGFVGAVSLWKGAPYFLMVARRFDPAKVRFVMVGRIALDPAVVAREKGHVNLVGRVPRSGVKEWLTRFDLFFFPSTCEGSAGAVIEALGAGLPIITTPNSGSSVREGIEGFITNYDDVDRQADCIAKLVADQGLRNAMSRAAFERHAVHHPDRYAEMINRVIHRVSAERGERYDD